MSEPHDDSSRDVAGQVTGAGDSPAPDAPEPSADAPAPTPAQDSGPTTGEPAATGAVADGHGDDDDGGDAKDDESAAATAASIVEAAKQQADAEDLLAMAAAQKARSQAKAQGKRRSRRSRPASQAQQHDASLGGSVYAVAPEVVSAQRRAVGNLESKAGFFSQLTFWYLNPIMRAATERSTKKGGPEFGPGTLYVAASGARG